MAAPTQTPERSTSAAEPRREQGRRYARRSRLYTWAAIAAATLLLLIVLVAENTHRVKVGWVFGHSRISLVYLVALANLLGWLLGIATSVIFRHRTRRPR